MSWSRTAEMEMEEEEEEEIDPTSWQEACWLVISSYFESKGLVLQQLESFNEFIGVATQQIIKNAPTIELEAVSQHLTNVVDEPVRVAFIVRVVACLLSFLEQRVVLMVGFNSKVQQE